VEGQHIASKDEYENCTQDEMDSTVAAELLASFLDSCTVDRYRKLKLITIVKLHPSRERSSPRSQYEDEQLEAGVAIIESKREKWLAIGPNDNI
jgi:hypothetical protein